MNNNETFKTDPHVNSSKYFIYAPRVEKMKPSSLSLASPPLQQKKINWSEDKNGQTMQKPYCGGSVVSNYPN